MAGVARYGPAKSARRGSSCSWAAPGGRNPANGVGLSSAMTAALPALTASLALEIAPVRINLIAAGFVDTPLSASLLGDALDQRREQLRDTLPIGRVVGPADVAALAVHIMSNTALTGATYDIDGGQQLVAILRRYDYAVRHHSGRHSFPITSCPITRECPRKLSELQGDDPLILTLARPATTARRSTISTSSSLRTDPTDQRGLHPDGHDLDRRPPQVPGVPHLGRRSVALPLRPGAHPSRRTSTSRRTPTPTTTR